MKTRWMITWALATAVASLPVGAVGRLVDMTVVDRTTQETLPVYVHAGRFYVAGQPGHRYGIQLSNLSGRRVLGVLSVDGVNALSGDTASWTQEGYVLSPYQSSDIVGWRKSLTDVADFVFADASRSYATRTGRPDNVGVIGIAVFLPRMPRPPVQPMPMPMPAPMPVPEASRIIGGAPSAPLSPAPPAPPPAIDNAMATPAMRADSTAIARTVPKVTQESGPLGTGHGERETSVVTTTEFDRASSTPNEVITLYYDTRERLIAQGVIPSDEGVASRPDPFPAHFVPDPH